MCLILFVSFLGSLLNCLLKSLDHSSIWIKSIALSSFSSLLSNCHKVSNSSIEHLVLFSSKEAISVTGYHAMLYFSKVNS